MFNLFKKINEGNKADCYLIKSGIFENKILDEDNLEDYNELLHDNEIPDFYKDLVRYFLLPYKISLLKFTLNKEYYEDPFPVDLQYDHKHIAPSLKKIKENPFDIAIGYPKWFFIAFPDVALWAMKGAGLELIERKFKNLNEEDVIDGSHIKATILNDIIGMYQNNTNKSLECKKY